MRPKELSKWFAVVAVATICSALSGASCGGGTEGRPRGEPGPVRIAGPVEPAGPAEPGPEIAGDPGDVDNPTIEPAVPEVPENPRALQLPIDPHYLGLGIPPADPARYRKWHQVGRIRVGQSHLSHAAVVGSGDRWLLAMSTAEATVRVYDRESRRLLGNHRIPGYDRFDRGDLAGWSASGGEALFLFGKQDGLWLFDGGSGKAVAQLDEAPVWQLRWSPDGEILAAGESDIGTQTSTLTFFHKDAPRSLARLGAIAFDERVDGWSLSRDNRLLAVVCYPSDTVELIDLRTGETTLRVPAPEFAGDVRLSPDGRWIAVGGADLRLIDVREPARRAVASGFGNNIGRVRFSPSGDAVVTSSYDGRIRIFGIDPRGPRLELIKTLKHAGDSNVYELLFVDGGVRLISTSGDKTIRYWGR